MALLQAVCIARLLQGDGEDRGPTLDACELAVLVDALEPRDAEGIRRGADDTRYFDGDLALADLREGIVDARIVVER